MPSVAGLPAHHRPNPFARFWELGYHRLLPVVPPAAGIRAAGKRPGILGPGGWHGASAASFEATLEQTKRWAEMEAGVGLRCVADVTGIDIDTKSAKWAAIIREIAIRHLGPSWPRIGNDPKTLLPYAMPEALTYRQIRFDDGVDPKKPGLVELLAGETKWFVVHGTHPATGRPYAWPEGVPARDELTPVTPAQVDAFFAELEATLPRWRGTGASSGVDRATIDQSTLVGDPERIRKAMAALPNDPTVFGYNEWLKVAAALRAALPQDEALAQDLFEDWTEKGQIDEPTESPTRVFWSLHPPFQVGAGWLYGLAQQHSGGAFTAADAHFDHEVAAAAIRAEEEAKREPLFPANDDAPQRARFRFEDFDELAASAHQLTGRPLIKGLLDAGAMSVLYGESNTGKTFVALDIAFSIGTGRAWGRLPVTPGLVVYIAAEGGRGFAKRIAALKVRNPEALRPDLLALRTAVDLRRPEADTAPLIAELLAIGRPVALVVVDTLSRAMAGGDENASTDMGALVRNLDAIRSATAAHLMVVHHSGKDRAKGARGHSLLRAATDTEIEIADGTIAVTKQRDLDKSFAAAFVLQPTTIGVDEDGDPLSSAVVRLLSEAETSSASALPPQEAERRVRIGRAAYASLRGASEGSLTAVRAALIDELRRESIKCGASDPSLRKLLNEALGGEGVVIDADNMSVRIQARKEKTGTAPWRIFAFRVPGERRSEADQEEENETDKMSRKLESARKVGVFE